MLGKPLAHDFSLSSKQHLHPTQSRLTRMGPRSTRDHLFKALSTFRKLLPASTVSSKVQPTRVVFDRFRQTVCISSEFGNFSSNHVFPPVYVESFWVRTGPFVLLCFFPVELPPSPPLRSSTPQGLRTDPFVVHSGNMTCPTEHTFSDGSQNVHVATSRSTDDQFCARVSTTGPFPSTVAPSHQSRCHHPRTPTRNFVSLCLDRRPDTRTPEKACHIVVYTTFKRSNLGSQEDLKTGLQFVRYLLA